ncbi:MAG: YncE family protein [Saprospiraceae bacterium]
MGTLLSAQDYYVYVTSESEDEVAVIKFDGEHATVEETITVGYNPTEIEGPHVITVSPDGKHWFLSMAHGMPYGKVYKYTTEDNKIVGSTELGLFPASMQISKATGLLYVVNFNLHGKMVPSSVSVVDPQEMVELTKVTTGAMPHGSRISADGMHQYSVSMMSGELFEISTIDLRVSRKLDLEKQEMDHSKMNHDKKSEMDHSKMDHSKMNHDKKSEMDHSKMDHSKMEISNNQMAGAHDMHAGMKHSVVKPTWVIPHPQGGRLYIAGNGSGEILEVDANKWEVTHRLQGGKGPYNVELTPDGKLMVVTYKSEATTAIWDLETRKELARIENSRRVSHGIAISSDGKYAFVSVEGVGAEPGSVDVIDLQKLEKVASANVGKQAGGIAFWKIETSK